MKRVEPEVYLIAQTGINWDTLETYCQEIGAQEWFARVSNDMDATEGEVLAEGAGRRCYRSWAPGLNQNVKKVRKNSGGYLHNILESMHGSVMEHPSATFAIENVSRVFTHEVITHRAGTAKSQESLRFVRLTEIPMWIDVEHAEDVTLMERCEALVTAMEEHQVWMADHFQLDAEGVDFEVKKRHTSFMRRFAPEGVATGLWWTCNVRALRHIIALRTAPAAEVEIRLVFDQIAQIAKEEWPLLFQDFKRQENGTWLPEFAKV